MNIKIFREERMKKTISFILVCLLTLIFASCGKESIEDINKSNSSELNSTAAESNNSETPQINYNASTETNSYEHLTNPRNGSWLEIVGDPMEQYFIDPKYATRSDPDSDNPIYSEESFIKGTYPLDGESMDYETARVIIIEFKESIDQNYLNPLLQTITIQTAKRFGKDLTNQFNFSYESATDKILITRLSYGSGFGSGDILTITIDGDKMKTSAIQEDNGSIDGVSYHKDGVPSRQLSGKYSFSFIV